MKIFMSRVLKRFAFYLVCALCVSACGSDLASPGKPEQVEPLRFEAEKSLGKQDANPATPFLRFAPDGRLFAIWTEDEAERLRPSSEAPADRRSGKMAPSPFRRAMLAASADGGKTWSAAMRVNSGQEAIQGEENGPKIAFTAPDRAYVVWSIPGAKGDKTRANIRFAMDDAHGGFTAARTLNEVKDAARFPIIEVSPNNHLLVAWIDRRIDNPKPRQLYLMRISPDGKMLTRNYPAGEGLCECCKLGIAFAQGGKTVYMVNRQVDAQQIRNHVLRKSVDGGATFGPPVQISDDGWQVPSCPHSGPSIVRDRRGWLHVSWFTLGRSEREAGIYYSVSRDDGKSFAPRRLVQANSAPEVLYTNLAVDPADRVYIVWSNLDANNRAQIFLRTISPDGRWGPIQQISRAKGDASRPVLVVDKQKLHVAWTETNGETSRAVLRSATVSR